MAGRSLPLTTVRGGITRLRTKGAALSDSLYDLLNGFLTAARTVTVRPGTFRDADLAAAAEHTDGLARSKGLVGFDGALHVFSAQDEDVPPGYVLHIIRHPLQFNDDGTPIQIHKIHFASPFMGFLYVVAEFETPDVDTLFNGGFGNVFHYWIQTPPEGEDGTWQAEHEYLIGDLIEPSVPNGLVYQATRLNPPSPAWQPDVTRALDDVVEPTVYNGFKFTVIDTQGANPRSGSTEPVWPETDGATVVEDADNPNGANFSTAVPADPNVNTTPNKTTQNRYKPSQIAGKGPIP